MIRIRWAWLVCVAAVPLLLTSCNSSPPPGGTSSGSGAATAAEAEEVEEKEEEEETDKLASRETTSHHAKSKKAAHPKDHAPFDPAKFSDPTNIDNEWYALKPGAQYVWTGTSVDDEGEELPHRVVFTVTDLVKEIHGVDTVVCWDHDSVEGEMVETEIVFLAQDDDGALWVLGEYPEEYEDGEFVAAPCWIHGFEGARAGILIPANPQPGTPSFSQGWSSEADYTDRAVVDGLDHKLDGPMGKFKNLLAINEWNLEEPGVHSFKLYASGVGLVGVRPQGGGDRETLDLVEKKELSPEELAEARKEALTLEAKAYIRSKDVYAHTEESEYGGPGEIELPTIELPKELTEVKKQERKITDEQAKKIALKEVPGDVTGIAIERKLGKQTIVVEVLSKEGVETDVIIDMETGEVLDTET